MQLREQIAQVGFGHGDLPCEGDDYTAYAGLIAQLRE
jgi:hypothetical protein